MIGEEEGLKAFVVIREMYYLRGADLPLRSTIFYLNTILIYITVDTYYHISLFQYNPIFRFTEH